MIFVNPIKEARAKEILGYFSKSRLNEDDLEIKERFAGHLADAKLKPDDKGALEFVYTKLGGLLRTEAEEKKVQENVKALKEKRKKK